ncbi:MAG TPA: hypothetical protein VGP28_00725, partial [Methylocella sp.]|nr:hypothetical protein [Methylocella sp.]
LPSRVLRKQVNSDPVGEIVIYTLRPMPYRTTIIGSAFVFIAVAAKPRCSVSSVKSMSGPAN